MNAQRKKALWQVGFGIALLFVSGFLYWKGNSTSTVSNFSECMAQGFPIMESYPRQCRTPDGQTFREDIGTELEKDNLIRVAVPRPNTAIFSPLVVKGMARGNWFFEASFPARLFDGNGEIIAHGIAQANPPAGGGWMTTEFVPFEVTLSFTAPTTTTGTLLLDKDNPSGLPENADELRIPIRFEKTATGTPPVVTACLISGCSGQICADEEMMSTCEFKEEYACYRTATCERQAAGKCGWTETPALRACIDRAK